MAFVIIEGFFMLGADFWEFFEMNRTGTEIGKTHPLKRWPRNSQIEREKASTKKCRESVL